MDEQFSKKAKVILKSGRPYFWAAFFEHRSITFTLVPIPLIESAQEYQTRDDVDVDYWLDTNVGMKELEDVFMVHYVPHMQWNGRDHNMALQLMGLYGEGNLLIMKLHSQTAIAHLVYEKDLYVHEENTTTSAYYHNVEHTMYQGALLGQLHFGMCMLGDVLFPMMHNNHWLRLGPTLRDSSGEILFNAQVNTLSGLFLRDQNKNLSSRGWIFEDEGHKQYLMLYADLQVVMSFVLHNISVDAPGCRLPDSSNEMGSQIHLPMTEDMLSESADFPVRVLVTLKKHLSASSRCEPFLGLRVTRRGA
ncbi:uncharacterized protein EV420DRAFT_1487903 [Desarmillaria tabescens]|uniref:Uncharacterized protein n=1 Tax=Armillaria tabescens TaxID=1929756 RepID=A0AA39MI42_ARMTA|nr:uncharacterized protein EV420DRAFT_1487903 [Desarmillaria tabescens]KAK0435691.1 hypothetical protein EV420DRAFT_1487903 [Desarmillaria tabescens]